MEDLKKNGIADLKDDPEAMLEKMINRNVKFQIVEYISAAAAVGGTIAAGLGQNVVFAAAPLTFSVCLNLFNRRQLDQLTRQRTFADLTEVQGRLTTDIQTLRGDFQNLPEVRETIDMTEMQAALNTLTQSVSALEEQALNPVAVEGEPQAAVTEEMAQLRNHQIELAEALESVKQQLEATPEVAEAVGPAINEELVSLKEALTQLEQRGETAVPNLEPLRAELQAMLTPLQTQVSALNDRVQQPDGNGEGIRPSEQVVEIQGHLENLNTKVDQAFVNLSDEMAAVRGTVEGTQHQVEDMRGALEQTQGQVSGLQEQFSGQESAEPLELQMQAALTPIKEHINSLDGKIQALPSFDPAAIQGQTDQLQALQGQVHSMGTRIDNVSAQVANEMENLPSLVEEKVSRKMEDALPATPPPPSEDEKKASKLFELDALLADLES